MEDGALESVWRLVTERGVLGRPLRRAIALLTEQPRSVEDLVHACALPRRSVEGLLAAIGGDLDVERGRLYIRPGRVAAYRLRFGYEGLRRSQPADPLVELVRQHDHLVAELEEAIAAAPPARAALDHVAATAATVVRRALWLDGTYDLAGARVLCLGDHDLTSLALAALRPDVTVAAVDVDDATLTFLDGWAAGRGLRLHCLFADLRVGLPPRVTAWADLVVTDPPYTPAGVRLFLGRGAAALRDRDAGRIVMAYGFSDRQPTLGLRVQQAAQGLNMVFEAILPQFNRYRGAQAVGGASDLYVCRPTPRTWRMLDRDLPSTAIYTRGPQSVEAIPAAPLLPPAVQPDLLLGDGWPDGSAAISLARLIADGVPPARRRGSPIAAVNLSSDHGGLLLRALLALNAGRVTLVVSDDHPDLATGTSRRALDRLVRHKYELDGPHEGEAPHQVILEATAVDATGLEPPARLRRRLLDHAHGKVANIWREGLIELRPDLTQNQARALIAGSGAPHEALDGRLLDLPRHQIAELLHQVEASAELVLDQAPD